MTRRSTRLSQIVSIQPKKSPRPKRQSVKPPIILNISSSSDEELITPKGTQKPYKKIDSDSETEINNENTEFLKPQQPRTPRKNKSKDEDLNRLSPVTPEKQQKFTNETPKTPSTLLKDLSLSPNVEKQNRKNLFKENVYQSARKALHGTLPTTMPGREKELKELREFIAQHLSEEKSASLYVSGPPGTGKTAALNTILENDIYVNFKKIYVNCTAIKSSGAIYSRILRDFGVKPGKTEKDNCTTIEKHLRRSHEMILLVLDEIDQLESKNQSILYTIFEWPSRPNSKLILIGIANALDLTDRILPRLQMKCDLKPKLMHFPPYTKQQIVEIFTNRLKQAGIVDSEVFTPIALQMLAGKVAAISGDVRRALDIGRRVIELIDQGRKQDILKSMENVTEFTNVVDLKQVVNILNNIYGTSQNITDDSDAFPLQQKIIVCTLLLILKKSKNKDVTVGKLHEIYRKICAKLNLLSVDQGEFVGLCQLIESKGIIRVVGRREMRLNRVHLVWDEEEVGLALRDKQLMARIMQEDLGKI